MKYKLSRCDFKSPTHSSLPEMIYSRNNPGNWFGLNVLNKIWHFHLLSHVYQLCCKKRHPVRSLTETVQTLRMSRFTWYRLARWCLVLIRKGWLTPGWSTSWAAAASSPSIMSDGVRKLASWITRVNHNKNMNSKHFFFPPFWQINKPADIMALLSFVGIFTQMSNTK